MLLLTTGPQATNQKPATSLADAAAVLKNRGVLLYAIGIGPDAVQSQLEDVASSNDYVYSRAPAASLGLYTSSLSQAVRRGRRVSLLVSLLISSSFNDFLFAWSTTTNAGYSGNCWEDLCEVLGLL